MMLMVCWVLTAQQKLSETIKFVKIERTVCHCIAV